MSLRRRSRHVAAGAWLAAAVSLLAACSGMPGPTPSATSPSPSPSQTAAAGPTIAPFPLAPATSTTPLPDDCRDLLPEWVVAELADYPYDAEGMGGGIRPDSSRVCVWGEPGTAATYLVTVLGYSPENDAIDALNALAEEGYTCYRPDEGVRCEKTWEHPTLPVEQGRTLYWRDGVIVDTQYSNLAPAGYTSALVAGLWPAGGRTPAPTPSPTP